MYAAQWSVLFFPTAPDIVIVALCFFPHMIEAFRAGDLLQLADLSPSLSLQGPFWGNKIHIVESEEENVLQL